MVMAYTALVSLNTPFANNCRARREGRRREEDVAPRGRRSTANTYGNMWWEIKSQKNTGCGYHIIDAAPIKQYGRL